ncbi:MAG: hypothetical protein GDA35_07605 [Hyphomonadaceae bacterium]|nr:hypothetical protein [Hyphomonadaceae bacterium]
MAILRRQNARPISRIHDVNPAVNLDRIIFIAAFVLGTVGSVLLKMTSGVHPFVPAGYAALILLLYVGAAWFGGRIKIEPETIGDNCYYLGFLFTLVSLAYTLYQMVSPERGKVVQIPEVISGFGVALSSTILGVFLRVLMMQLRPDFVAKDREMRAEINKAFDAFRKDMSRMLSQMKAFSTESVQLAAERDERIRASTEKFSDEYREMLKENANLLSTHIKEAFPGVAGQATKDTSAAQHIPRLSGVEPDQVAGQATKDVSAAPVESRTSQENRLQWPDAEFYEDVQASRRQMVAALEECGKLLKLYNEEIKANSRAMQSAADAIEKRLTSAPAAPEQKAGIDTRNRGRKDFWESVFDSA